MAIDTNRTAIAAGNDLGGVACNLLKSLKRLCSGSKVVHACNGRPRQAGPVSPTQAARANASHAQSFLRAQNAYLQQVGGALDQMSLLAASSQATARTDDERAAFQQEFATLAGYITVIAAKNFNGVSLFSGTLLILAVTGDSGTLMIPGLNLNLAAYTRATTSNIATSGGATAALPAVTAALAQWTADSASISASEKRVLLAGAQLAVLDDNLSASLSARQSVNNSATVN